MSYTNKILDTVRTTIAEHNMFNNGDTVVVGVSGGADSVMLLHCLNVIKNDYNLNIVVAHINHKIRIGTAERDAKFVEDLCEKMGIEYHLKEIDIPTFAEENSMSEEEAGRLARYSFFSELAGKSGKIATAHNANDNVETVLMRFMRGTGVKGLSGIPYKRGNIVRPILNVSRTDIEGYIEENGLEHITDETNFENIYTRNKIRLDLIPFMQEKFNPNLINTVSESIMSYREDAEYFDNIVNELFETVVSVEENRVGIPIETLKEQHCSISKRLISKCLMEFLHFNQLGISPAVIDSFYKAIDMKVGTTLTVNKNCRIRVSYEYLYIEGVEEMKLSEYYYDLSALNMGNLEEDHVYFMDYNLSLGMYRNYDLNIDNNGLELNLPTSKYNGKKIVIRNRRKGDVFRVDDNTHKNLNRVFSDKKIDAGLRDSIPLVCCGNEVLWAVGYFATRFGKRKGEFYKIIVEN